jgi:Mu transposase, C-terminal domain
LNHYGLEGDKTQAASPNEIGDVEQRHYRFKKALDQALMLRGSRDFTSRDEYAAFMRKLFSQLNSGRRDRFAEELKVFRRLPERRLESCKRLRLRVGPSSTIRVNHNVYSVHSRLNGEMVEVRLYVEHLELWYAQRCVEKIPRLRGEGKHRIQYRHIIDWLVRKPGAFENYRYRNELFPTHRFRMAYDYLKQSQPARAAKQYLKILHLAARESEIAVDDALRTLIDQEQPIAFEAIEAMVHSEELIPPPTELNIQEVDLTAYDALLALREVATC